MSLKLLIVAALLLLVLDVDVSSGTFCDEGPPGRYCFADLAGWYECMIDSKTQKMTEKLHYCKVNTRCQCFYGPNCASTIKDPCAKYELPPPFPEVFSAFFTMNIMTCVNKACVNETVVGELLQNAWDGLQRYEEMSASSWNSKFIFRFPLGMDKFQQFDAAWFEKNCSMGFRTTFPRFEVPPYFSCDPPQRNVDVRKLSAQISAKMDNATLKVCSWQSGGHSKTEQVTIEHWVLMSLPDGRYIPYLHQVDTSPSSTSNTTLYYDTLYASFFADFMDRNQLAMPNFCYDAVANEAE